MPDGSDAPWNTPQTQEAWTNLAKQLPKSEGEFAGPATAKDGSTTDGGKQWLRKISLIVYKQESAGGPDQDFSGGKDNPKPAARLGVPQATATAATPAASSTTGANNSATQPASQGLEIAALRVTFNVHKNTNQTPSELDARIYNLAPATMKKIIQFGRVQLSAGYKYGQYGLIFDGKVVQYRRGKENPTDTYLDIKAFDGDALSKSISRHRFEAGTKESTALNQFIKDLGIPPGYISPLVGTDILLRPWIIAGMTHKYIRDLMLKYNAHAYPDLNKFHVVPQKEYLPGVAVVLSPKTGLVGIPEATPEGIQIRCLLNPKIRLGGLVKLDNSLISGVAFVPGSGEVDQSTFYSGQYNDANYGKRLDVPVPTSPIGTYKIYMIEYTGDTRGQPWYCDLICIGLDSSGKPMTTKGSVFDRQPSNI
jgi:hypothetical protein